MKTIGLVTLLSIMALLQGCNNNPVIPEATQIVLRGYLYVNEPVQDIEVMSSFPIGSSDSTNPPITTATVALLKGSNRYQLSPDTLRPGYYYYPGTGLTVNVGDVFSIVVGYGGQSATAQTVVPPKPQNVALSVLDLRFQTDTIQARFGTRISVTGLDTAIVTWDNPDGQYFYIVTESIDSTAQLLRPDSSFTRRFTSEPTNESSYRINNNSILYTGKHVLRVYRVNKEYADLYRTSQQDSRELNEPLTNVSGGLGIFSAFASDSLYFTVSLDSTAPIPSNFTKFVTGRSR